MESKLTRKGRMTYLIVKLVVFSLLGVFVFIFKDGHVQHLKPFIGTLMLLYGAEGILYGALCHHLGLFRQSRTYLGLVELILGLVLIISELPFDYVCIIWATWSIVRESHEVKEIVTDLETPLPKVLSGAESIAVFIFSVLLIVNPNEGHAVIHLGLLTIELILNPLVVLIDEWLLDRKEKKAQGDTPNKDEEGE
ncbi:MAG: hypothetical protein K6E59_05310 [Bacilli bacterium]|nr:hypothetical protein [Bacilli bacterium]